MAESLGVLEPGPLQKDKKVPGQNELQRKSRHKCGKQLIMSVSCFASAVTRFFVLFEKYEGYKTGKLKLKKPDQLQVSLGAPSGRRRAMQVKLSPSVGRSCACLPGGGGRVVERHG